MKINTSARCIDCDDGMGEPIEVTVQDEEEFTLYKCVFCDEDWLRPHHY